MILSLVAAAETTRGLARPVVVTHLTRTAPNPSSHAQLLFYVTSWTFQARLQLRGVVTRRCHQVAASAAPAYPPNFNTNDLPPTCMKVQTEKHFVVRKSERDF